MKTLLGTRKYLLVLPILVVAGGLIISYGQQKPSTTDEGWVDQGIVIHSTIALSDKDVTDLIDKLGKFDKSLYKLEKLKNGAVEKTWGAMELCDKLEAEMTNSKPKGLSVFQTNFTPAGTGPAGGANASVSKRQAKDLIKAITPILSKYQR